MSSSLDLLIKNLSDNDFKYLSQKYCGNLLRLVKQKGVYIYDYMDNFRKFSDEKLPDRLNFFNSIKNECVSEKNISEKKMLKRKTMDDCHDLYLKTNVLLLADVFEKIINTCLESYELDPCHYFSSRG